LRFIYVTNMAGSGGQYAHFGCNGNAYCVISTTVAPSPSYYRTVTGVSFVGVPPQVAQITTSAAHPWTNGNKVVLGQIVGSAPGFGTCLNHIWTITYVDTTHFTLDGSDCSATGTYASGGLAATGETIPPGQIHRQNTVVYLDGAASFAYPTNIHRSVLYGNNDYWSTPRTSISRNGAYIGYVTTMGLLGSGEELAVYIAATGLGGAVPSAQTQITGAPKITGAVKVQ